MEKIRKVELHQVRPSDIELLKNNPDEFWKDVTEIGSSAFECVDNFEKITIPSGIEKIEEFAFYRSKNLRQVGFSEGLLSIGLQAFFRL